jgi:hypothetical protein
MSEMLGRADMLCPSGFVRYVPILLQKSEIEVR